jgi:hypothetical protein
MGTVVWFMVHNQTCFRVLVVHLLEQGVTTLTFRVITEKSRIIKHQIHVPSSNCRNGVMTDASVVAVGCDVSSSTYADFFVFFCFEPNTRPRETMVAADSNIAT